MNKDEQLNEEYIKKLNEKVCDENWKLFHEQQTSQLNFKMSQELRAGLFVLNSSSKKLLKLLKSFLAPELKVLTDKWLNHYYQELIKHIECVLNHNKFIKELKEYENLKNLCCNFPDAISSSTIEYTDWEKVLEDANRLEAKISKLCSRYGGEIYTAPSDDQFITMLKEAEEAIKEHWEIKTEKTQIKGNKVVNQSYWIDFDSKNRKLKLGNKEGEPLPRNSIELFIVMELFNLSINERAAEDDLLEALTKRLGDKPKSHSAVSDAVKRVNQKANKDLNIDELIKSEGSNFWLNPDLRNIKQTPQSQT